VIPASSSNFTQLYNNSRASISNGSPLPVYEKEAGAAANGAKAAQTADAYLASGNNAKAVELYGMALTKGGVNTDEINLRLGTALVHLGRRDEAKAAFAKVSGAPLADVAHFWALWLDTPQLSS
jgi:tetratricopeptide (TPR) repeat protein